MSLISFLNFEHVSLERNFEDLWGGSYLDQVFHCLLNFCAEMAFISILDIFVVEIEMEGKRFRYKAILVALCKKQRVCLKLVYIP